MDLTEEVELRLYFNEAGTALRSYPGDRFFAVLARRLNQLVGSSRIVLIACHSGALFAESLFPSRVRLASLDPLLKEYWKLAELGRDHPQCWAIIPLYDPASDPLTGRQLRAAIVIEGVRSDGIRTPAAERRHRSTIRRIGNHIGEAVLSHLQNRLLNAHRRLSSVANRLVLPADTFYHVAHEIRSLLRYDDVCAILRLNRHRLEPGETDLEVFAVLPGNRSPQAFDAEEPSRSIASHNLDVEEVLSLAMDAYVVTSANGRPGWSVRAIRRSGRGETVLEVSSRLELQLSSLCDNLVTAGVASGATLVLSPLIWRRELLGVLLVSTSASSAFTLDEVLVASDLSKYAVGPLARDRQSEVELDLLKTTSELDPEIPLTRNQPLKAFLSLICERLRLHRGAEWVVVIPYDSNKGKMLWTDRAASYRQTPEDIPFNNESHDLLLRSVLASGDMEQHDLGDGDAGPLDFIWRQGIRSFYTVSLVTAKEMPSGATVAQPVGILFVGFTRLKAVSAGAERGPRISEADKKWIRLFARILQEHLSQHDRVAKHTEVERAIQRLYENLRADASTDATLNEIFNVAVGLVGATAGVLAVPCGEHRDLRVVCSLNLPPTREGSHIAFGDGVTGYCGEEMATVIIPDSTDEQTWPPGVRPLPWIPGSKTEMAIPLVSEEELIGVLDVENQTSTAAFGKSEQDALTQLARASVIAVELTQTLQQLDSLSRIGRSLMDAGSDLSVFHAVLKEIQSVSGAYSVSARVVDPTQRVLEPVMHLGDGGAFSDRGIGINEGACGWVYQTQTECFIADVAENSWVRMYPGIKYISSRPRTQCEFTVPITWRGDRIGTINVEHVQPNGLKRYRRYVAAIAGQAAYVLYQRRHQLRELRQRDLDIVTGVAEFATHVGHEMEGRLASIGRGADAARVANPTHADVFIRIREEAEAALRELHEMVRDVPKPFSPRPGVRPTAVVRQVIETYTADDPSLLSVFQLSIAPEADVTIYGHEVPLTWCLRRIIDNSLRYSNAAPRILIAVSLAETRFLEIVISDNGPGIPENELGDLYEWQKERLRPRSRGYALPLCRAYIGALSGIIRAENAVGGGLTTRIFLPVEEVQDARAADHS